MISFQRLLKMARKWQKFTVDARRRISISRTVRLEEVESCIRPLANKGHFIVYTIDDRRFMVPLAYLKNPILLELFRMSEEQFGLPCNGPITMPCDAIFMDYVVSLIHRHVSKDVEKALVTSPRVDAPCHPCYNIGKPTNKYFSMASKEAINCIVGTDLSPLQNEHLYKARKALI